MNKIHDGFRNPTVREVFKAHIGRQIDKWSHYFPIYEKHFAKYVDQAVRVLEIGIDHGGSLQMWKEYFGPRADIMGVDINPDCKVYEEDQIHVLIADQCSLRPGDIGPFDIVIDDGSHIREHQSATFNNLWGDTHGVYLIEDCHGAYPALTPHPDMLVYRYPQVIVIERAKRIIRGTPSHALRPDEVEARKLYAE